MSTVRKIITSVLISLLCFLLYFWTQPCLSLLNISGILYISFCIICASIIVAIFVSEDLEDFLFEKKNLIVIIPTVISIVYILIVSFASCSIFNDKIMANQIGEMNEKEFSKDVLEIDNSQIPIVDLALADKLADKKLGEDPGLGSQARVGDFTNKQSVNGKLVYVAPLEHTGFLKWYDNKEGTTGYIIVSATDLNDVQLIRKVNDKEIRLKYLPSACFGTDLKRHIRDSGFRTTFIDDTFNFELDDKYNPYWIVTTYENKTLVGNPEANGIIVCDAQSGECKWYSVKDAPKWVDIIQPEDFVKEQITNWGELSPKGWWNPSDEGKLKLTQEEGAVESDLITVYNNGECYYYTGLTSYGADKGTIGFLMVNSRTKEVTKYSMAGATQEAAESSAEGEVSDKGYTASKAIPLNISSIPTYFMTLKDEEGLVKQYAFVNIESYAIVGVGDTIASAKRNYISDITSVGNKEVVSGEAYMYELEGKISRISSNVENANTYYYLVIDSNTTKLFMASYDVSEELPITREGDKVKISYIDDSNGVIDISKFDNLDFKQNKSQDQEDKDKINSSESTDNVTQVDPSKNEDLWDKLTDEEKSKLLENLE